LPTPSPRTDHSARLSLPLLPNHRPSIKQPTIPPDRSFGTGRPSILHATPLVNYDCGEGCGVPCCAAPILPQVSVKVYGLGQDKRVCRRPLGGQQMARAMSRKIKASATVLEFVRRYGTTRYFTPAAFVPLTPGTIVALERVLRNTSAWEE
jgi:hypothetical protein